MSQHDTLTLRDALRNIQYEAASLADAQVIALQALNATYPARAALSATQPAQAAQGAPAEHWHRLYLEKCQQYNDRVAQLGGVIEGLEAEAAQGEVANVPLAWQTTREGLLAYVLQDDLHNRLTPRVIDIAYTAFMYGARGRNTEDGSQCDWFNDTKPAIEKAIAKLRKDLFEASNAPTQPAAGADVLDAVSPVGDWSYSHDEERFSGQFDTKEAAIAEGLSCGARFVGQVNHVRDIISDGQIGWDIYERIGEILGDEIGEVAECFTLSPDQQEVLGKVVLDWIESGPGFNCWGIKDVEPIDAAIAASGRKS